jgi:hypothetical protein
LYIAGDSLFSKQQLQARVNAGGLIYRGVDLAEQRAGCGASKRASPHRAARLSEFDRRRLNAGICRKWDSCECGAASEQLSIRLCCDPEDLFHVMHLTQDVIFCQPPNLSLTNHIHGFVSPDGSQGYLDGSEPEAGGHTFLHKSVILFQNII